MLYAAKCYWPQVTEVEVRDAGARASREGDGYQGALLFPSDQLVLYLFEARSRTAVKRTSQAAGLPCERLMDAAWFPSPARRAFLAGETR